MYVKDKMSRNVVTAKPGDTVSYALDCMGKGKFHRLPVVNEKNELVGLVTAGLIDEVLGTKATTLSVYELHYLESKMPLSDLMITDVITIGQDALLEAAAEKMADANVNVLPVVDEGKHVLGIITDHDLYKAFVEMLGYHHQGTRFVFKCKDIPGEFAKITQLFAQENANLEAISVDRTQERGTEAVVKATGEISVENMVKVLEDAGIDVVNVIQTK